MMGTAAQIPGAARHFPRSGPGTGPTSRHEAALRAEITHLGTRLAEMEREQGVQFQRIAQIQQELDEIKRLLKTIAGR